MQEGGDHPAKKEKVVKKKCLLATTTRTRGGKAEAKKSHEKPKAGHCRIPESTKKSALPKLREKDVICPGSAHEHLKGERR